MRFAPFLLLLPILLSTGCALKHSRLMQGGLIENEAYTQAISYEERMGLIILNVSIKGKERRFLLDTGAPNVLTKELAEELNLPVLFRRTVGDSQQRRGKLDYVQVEEIRIGELVFKEMLALVVDINASPVLRCLEVDGIIGANLMRKSAWQIDYENQEILIAAHRDSLPYLDESIVIPFKTSGQGTPRIELQVDEVASIFPIIDSGSNSNMDVPVEWFTKNYKSKAGQYYSAYGAASAGIYGHRLDSTYLAVLKGIRADSVLLEDQVVEFEENGGFAVGNKWLDQYVVSFDWVDNQLFLYPVDPNKLSDTKDFGFKPIYEDNQLKVGFVIHNSPADKAGMKVGDRIFFMNGIDCLSLNNDGFCTLIVQKVFSDSAQLDILFESEGTTKKAKLERMIYFED